MLMVKTFWLKNSLKMKWHTANIYRRVFTVDPYFGGVFKVKCQRRAQNSTFRHFRHLFIYGYGPKSLVGEGQLNQKTRLLDLLGPHNLLSEEKNLNVGITLHLDLCVLPSQILATPIWRIIHHHQTSDSLRNEQSATSSLTWWSLKYSLPCLWWWWSPPWSSRQTLVIQYVWPVQGSAALFTTSPGKST